MPLELHPEARAEPRSAALWYDERRPGLGDEFIAEVSLPSIELATPASCPAWPGTQARDPLICKTTVQRFPYAIAFEEHERHLLVLAVVAHSKRRPLYWLTRAEA